MWSLTDAPSTVVDCQRSAISPDERCASPEPCGTCDRPCGTCVTHCTVRGLTQVEGHKATPGSPPSPSQEKASPPPPSAAARGELRAPLSPLEQASEHQDYAAFLNCCYSFKIIFLHTPVKLPKAKLFAKLNIQLGF